MAICPYCGSENADTNSFCSECGGPLKEQQVPVAPEPPAQPFEAPVQTPVQPQSAASFTAPSEPGCADPHRRTDGLGHRHAAAMPGCRHCGFDGGQQDQQEHHRVICSLYERQ